MPKGHAPADDAVYSLTSRGDSELKAARTSLSAVELGILVLVDGQASVKQIAKSSGASVPRAQVDAALRTLLDKQLIISADEPSALESGFFKFTPALAPLPAMHPEAEQGVASLRNKGYYVRIARSAPKKRELPQGRQARVLLVDDDPDLARLIRTFFRFEGIEVQVAAGRAEIMAAFRASTPDLVLLDVALPDANGFDVLARMREHAVLKAMPVIMLTAEATREAVLRGLQAGADGYITKPFEPQSVVTAVREVLGLAQPKADPELS